MIRIKALSTVSIVGIDTVWLAKATPTAGRKPTQARRTGRLVGV